jgi:hypothetical protein
MGKAGINGIWMWPMTLAGIFNLFNSRGASASYYYTSRLPGEPAEGVAGYQRHPMEPRSARFTIARMF